MATNALSEAQRAQLDAVVQRMHNAGETPENIQLVVNDFKTKYASPEQVKAAADLAAAPTTGGEVYPSPSITGGVVSGLVGEAKKQGMAILDAIKAGVEHTKTGTLPEGPGMGAITAAIMAPVHAVQRMGAGTPEDLGAGMLQTAENAPVVMGAGKGVVAGASRVPGAVGAAARALPESAAPLVSAAGVAHGLYTGNAAEALASAAGEGTLQKLINRAKKLGLPKTETPPARVVPGATKIVPAGSAEGYDYYNVEGGPQHQSTLMNPAGHPAPVPGPLTPTTTPQQALAASHAQRMTKLAADNANPNLSLPSSSTFPSPMWGAISEGGSMLRQEGLPAELEARMMDAQAREADALTNMPRHMRDANLEVVSGASGIGNELSPASTVEKVKQSVPTAGPVTDVLQTLQEHLKTIPSAKKSWYEPPTATPVGKLGNVETFRIDGGEHNGAVVTKDQLETLGIEKPKVPAVQLAVSHQNHVTKIPMGESGPLHAPGVTVRGPRMTPARADLRTAMMDRLMQHYTENTPY
jgi:hypothetical protein